MLSLTSPHLSELTIASTQILYQLSVVTSVRDRLGSYLPLEREVEVMLPVYHQNKVLFHQGTGGALTSDMAAFPDCPHSHLLHSNSRAPSEKGGRTLPFFSSLSGSPGDHQAPPPPLNTPFSN